MKIKDVSEKVGLSHQAIYKRLRTRNIRAEDITDKAGNITDKGLDILKDLFPILQASETKEESPAETEEPAPPPADTDKTEVGRLHEEVARLQGEVARLHEKVATLEEKGRLLQDERDYLRTALDQSQKLQAITASKLPNPPPALTDGSEEKGPRRGPLGWLKGRRERKGE